jgi:hypothetical protein
MLSAQLAVSESVSFVGDAMKTYPIPIALFQDIVNYLQRQPWQDVNPLLVEISKFVASIDAPPQIPKVNGGDEARP